MSKGMGMRWICGHVGWHLEGMYESSHEWEAWGEREIRGTRQSLHRICLVGLWVKQWRLTSVVNLLFCCRYPAFPTHTNICFLFYFPSLSLFPKMAIDDSCVTKLPTSPWHKRRQTLFVFEINRPKSSFMSNSPSVCSLQAKPFKLSINSEPYFDPIIRSHKLFSIIIVWSPQCV